MRRSHVGGIVLAAFLPACGSSLPDDAGRPALEASFTSVEATPLPCRGSGPCPPGQTCEPPPPCAPQYEVSATLRLRPAFGEPLAMTTFEAELVDVASQRLASPQAFSAPAVPFSIAPAGSDVRLSFLTRQGAEPFGGNVRAVLAGTDARGEPWTSVVSAPVTAR